MEDASRSWKIGLLIIAALAIGMWAFSPTEVVVTGTGRVSVPATHATINITLSAQDESSSSTALTQLQQKIETIKRVLSEMGTKPEDIIESQLTLTPGAAIVANGKGFQAVSTLIVKLGNVERMGDVIVSMYASGATLVSQPVVTVEEVEKLEKQALEDALAQARANLRNTVGIWRPIRKIINIQQASSGNAATNTKMAAEGGSGEFEVVKAVSVTYRVW